MRIVAEALRLDNVRVYAYFSFLRKRRKVIRSATRRKRKNGCVRPFIRKIKYIVDSTETRIPKIGLLESIVIRQKRKTVTSGKKRMSTGREKKPSGSEEVGGK